MVVLDVQSGSAVNPTAHCSSSSGPGENMARRGAFVREAAPVRILSPRPP